MRPSDEFDRLARGFLADYLEFYPTLGSSLGLHLYDGRAGDYAEASIDAWLRTLTSWEKRLKASASGTGAGQTAHDAALIEGTIAYEHFRWNVLREHTWNPISWSGALDVTTYLKRNYAPLPERLRALAAHLEEVPRLVAEMIGHLRDPLTHPVAEASQEVFSGFLAFYEDTLPRHVGDADDPALRHRLEAARAEAVGALEGLSRFLDDARGGAHAQGGIGEEAFATMLRVGEMVDVPLDRLLALGEAELARLTDDVAATAARIDPTGDARAVMARQALDHPSEEALIPDTRALLDDLRQFLVDQRIVTVPGDVRPLVEETPPFARWAFAMMDTAGPFEETATESYYYVTPPEPSWPPERRRAWLTKFDYATLKAVSIHEAYPGHFIHFMHLRGAPSMPARVLTSYSFVEGWAHYCEEMMVDAGVDSSHGFRLAYLAEALVRVVRYLAAIRMHAGGLGVDDAARLFETHAFMEPLTARKEAVRGSFDPGYLNYTLGKFMVRRLRDDYRSEHGAAFSLQEFHDRLIGLGAPPVPLARRALLADGGGPLL